MKTNISLLVLLIFSSPLWAQDRVFFSLNPGMSLYNSENSMSTMVNGSIGWLPGFSVGYENDSLVKVPVRVDYSFTYAFVRNAMQFTVTSSSGPEPTGSFGANITFVTNNFDFAVVGRPIEFVAVTAGPTVSAVYRTISLVPPAILSGEVLSLDDRLASVCVGLNCSLNFEVPLEDGPNYVFFFSDLELRYIHSVWFDSRGRDTGDYYQSSLMGHVGVGLGYKF